MRTRSFAAPEAGIVAFRPNCDGVVMPSVIPVRENEQILRPIVRGHAVPMVNVTRPDEVRPGLSNEEALRNAPARAGGLFVVPKIVE